MEGKLTVKGEREAEMMAATLLQNGTCQVVRVLPVSDPSMHRVPNYHHGTGGPKMAKTLTNVCRRPRASKRPREI